MTRAPFATAHRIALRLGLDRDRALGPDDLRDEELRRGREARDPDAVVRPRGDQPGDERAVPLRVDRGRTRRRSSSRPRSGPRSSGCVAVDARVDHGDTHGGERRWLDPRVERAVLRGIPLPRQERIVGLVRDTPGAERLRCTAFPRRRGGRRRPGAETASARIGARSTTRRRAAGAERRGDGGCVGRRRERRPRSAPRMHRPEPRRGRALTPRGGPTPSLSLRLSRRNVDRERGAYRLAVGRQPVGRGGLRPHRDGEGAVRSGVTRTEGSQAPVRAELLEQRCVDVARETRDRDRCPGRRRGAGAAPRAGHRS